MTIVLTYRYTTMGKWPPVELSPTRNRGLSVKKERKNAPVASMISVLPKHRKVNADAGDHKSMVGDANSMAGDAYSMAGDANSMAGDANSMAGDAKIVVSTYITGEILGIHCLPRY